MQQSLFDFLPLADYDPLEAAKLAGYANPHTAVKELRKEIAHYTEELLANQSLRAAKTLMDVLSSTGPIINLKEKINVAQDVLDRTGHAKKVIQDINHNVKGGVFIIPEKKPITLEAEYTADES